MQLTAQIGLEDERVHPSGGAPLSGIFAYVAGGFLLCGLIFVALAITAKPVPGHD